MSVKHPYVTSAGGLVKTINQLRKSFPATVTAQTLKRLGFAPKNETYIVNTLRYLGVIDEKGQATQQGKKAFAQHPDEGFQVEFSALVERAYSALFQLYGPQAWALDTDKLITFFRDIDQSSEVVGKRQAITFRTLAQKAGHLEVPESPKPGPTGAPSRVKAAKPRAKAATRTPTQSEIQGEPSPANRKFGLTVRIEVNLPAEGDQATYDRIFKSIKENLLNE
jgi:hypothetical protein